VSGLDVLSARVAFRDRGLLDVLDLALRFLAVHARPYGRLAVVALLPPLVLAALAGEALGWVWGWMIALTLAWLASVPFTVLASRLVFQTNVRVRDVLRTSLADAPRLFGARLLQAMLVGFAAGMFVAPALWAITVLFFVDEVSLLERSSAAQSLSRSQRITAGGRMEAFLAFVLLTGIVALAVLLADVGGRAIVSDLLLFRAPRPFWTDGGSTLCLVGLFAVVPYATTARFFTYLNLRTRTEGWDIQTRFAAIAALADAAPLSR
jgi:hypothetical protein